MRYQCLISVAVLYHKRQESAKKEYRAGGRRVISFPNPNYNCNTEGNGGNAGNGDRRRTNRFQIFKYDRSQVLRLALWSNQCHFESTTKFIGSYLNINLYVDYCLFWIRRGWPMCTRQRGLVWSPPPPTRTPRARPTARWPRSPTRRPNTMASTPSRSIPSAEHGTRRPDDPASWNLIRQIIYLPHHQLVPRPRTVQPTHSTVSLDPQLRCPVWVE